MSTSLTQRQKKFIAAYAGNATAAARVAGYTGTDATLAVTGYHLLRNPKVREGIAEREEGMLSKLVLTREERQEFWSETAADPTAPLIARLKASELLGKSQADFTEKHEHNVGFGLLDLVREASGKEPSK